MYWELAPNLEDTFNQLEKNELLINENDSCMTILDKEDIKKILPHRDPMLFIDSVSYMNSKNSTIVAHLDLKNVQKILAGHFPLNPLFPGVLQIEAVGQAGIVLYKNQEKSSIDQISLSHICGAKFIKEIRPPGKIEMRVKIFEEGLFVFILGQCLLNGEICSIIALRGLI